MENNNVGLLGEEDISRQGEVAQKQETKTAVIEDSHSATHTEDIKPPEEFDDKLYQKVDWEKRYGDMRRYHDKVLSEKEQEIQSLMDQVNHGKDWSIPRSTDELEKIKESDPKFYEAIQQGAKLHYDANVEKLKLENIQFKKEAELAKIKLVHPDIDNIKDSKEFKDWVKEQPDEIKDWLFKKIDSKLWSKAIDLFKKENKVDTSNTQNKSENSAADQVVTKQNVQDTSNNEHIFTRKEIDKMSTREFEKNKEIIESQWRRGLIR